MSDYHGFDRTTRRHTGPVNLPLAALDPVNQSAAPFDALPFAPEREAGEYEVILVNETFDNWEFVPDFTGTVYKKSDRTAVEHKDFGVLPDHLTHLKPETQWDEWQEDQQKWLKSLDKEKQYYADQAYQSFQAERENYRSTGFDHRGHKIEAREVDQGNIIAILTGYTEGVRAVNAVVHWKVDTNVYLPLNGKSEAVGLAAAMDAYVQTLFRAEGVLGAEVAKMSTDQLKVFDAKAAFKEAFDKIQQAVAE